MTTAILMTPAIRAPLIPSYCRRIGTGILLVVLADFLFRGQPAGVSALLFGIVLAATVVAMDPTALDDGRVWLKPAALFAALLPLVENVGPLSVAAPGLALIIARIALTKSKKMAALRQSSDAIGGTLCRLLRQKGHYHRKTRPVRRSHRGPVSRRTEKPARRELSQLEAFARPRQKRSARGSSRLSTRHAGPLIDATQHPRRR